MSQHRVELVQLLDLCLDDGWFDLESLCHLCLALGVLREELVQRRVEQPNCDRTLFHRAEQAASAAGSRVMTRRPWKRSAFIASCIRARIFFGEACRTSSGSG